MRNAYQEYRRLRTEILRGLRAADEAHDDGRLSADAYTKILLASAADLGLPVDLDALREVQALPIHVHRVDVDEVKALPRIAPAQWLRRDPQRLALLCFARTLVEELNALAHVDASVICHEQGVVVEWLDGEPQAVVLGHGEEVPSWTS